MKARHGIEVNPYSKKDVSKALRRVFPEHKVKSRETILRIAAKAWNVPSIAAPQPPTPSVATHDFLLSYEWRRVRMQALKKYGARCQCCGATPSDGVKMNVDHIKPRKLFPQLALEVDNLQVLCEECNHGKGNWDMTDWRGDAVTSAEEEGR